MGVEEMGVDLKPHVAPELTEAASPEIECATTQHQSQDVPRREASSSRQADVNGANEKLTRGEVHFSPEVVKQTAAYLDYELVDSFLPRVEGLQASPDVSFDDSRRQSTPEETDNAQADALELAMTSGTLGRLLGEERQRLSQLRDKSEVLNQPIQGRIVEDSVAHVEETVDVETRVTQLLHTVTSEMNTVGPVVKRVQPLLLELQRLQNALVYANSGHLTALTLNEDEPPLEIVLRLCRKYAQYKRFLHSTRESDLFLGAEMESQVRRCVKLTKKRLEREVGACLKAIHWPITTSNPSLHLTPERLEDLSSALSRLTELQLTSPEATDLCSGSHELVGDLWAIKALVKPLLQRFRYHFSGDRATNRIDHPEWYFGFIQHAVKDHSAFFVDTVQPLIEAQLVDLEVETTFVDVLAHLTRAMVRIAHKHLEVHWSVISQSQALVCKTIDEALALDNTLVTEYDYCAVSFVQITETEMPVPWSQDATENTWPKLSDFFVSSQDRFITWMDSDLEFARKRIAGELSQPTAWATLADTIKATSDFTLQHRERMHLPECSDHVLGILATVSERVVSLGSAQAQIVFLRVVLLPLVQDYVRALQQRMQLSKSSLREQLALLNAAGHPRNAFMDWELSPRYLLLNQLYSGQEQNKQEGPKETEKEETPASPTKQRHKGARGLLQGALQKTRAAGGKFIHLSKASISHAVAQKGEGDNLQACKNSIFSPEIKRLEEFMNSNLNRICEALLSNFKTRLQIFVEAIQRGALRQTGAKTISLPPLAEGLKEMSSAVLDFKTRLTDSLSERAVAILAKGIQQVILSRLFEGQVKVDESGAQKLAKECAAVYHSFSPFAKRPDNRFFRQIKDRLTILTAPKDSVLSLESALRRLMSSWDGSQSSPAGKQLMNILEDGYGISSLAPADALVQCSLRLDVPR
eukprot:CAMPEP_0184530228 /NCGR_PEP_ID=MMETSP0198_2-20121128/12831_1 /TAXON_ID=1112570 /ORGANISM="Thraustochytrium sp., Strain LLF1b" /LENGTH=926 /DNA_ID=CAMNT_0026922363 /DNA_START=106 /DNA_END=2886 /DNA_ORIENTATION=-